jgi:histidinol-phosphate aminotransferase
MRLKEVEMAINSISRREFAYAAGGLAAALATPDILKAAGPGPRRFAHPGREKGIWVNFNENPYGPSPKALAAITDAESAAMRYPEGLYEQVTEAIAHLHGVARENVLLGCGSTEILRMADMAFLGAGKNLVVTEPTFEAVLEYARVTRAEAVKIPLTADFRHDLPRMAAACTSKTGLVFLCNPNNPTGTVVTREELGEFFARVPATTMALVDEAYYDFVEDARCASAFEWMGKMPNLVVARTFSKVYGLAGMRLGYGVGSRQAIEAMRAHRVQENGNVAVLSAALASLADTGNRAEVRKRLNDTRRWLGRELEKDGRRTMPSEANFVMLNLGRDAGPVIAEFQARGIHVGRRFPSLSDWLRVSMGTQPEMEAFLSALREIVPASAARAA